MMTEFSFLGELFLHTNYGVHIFALRLNEHVIPKRSVPAAGPAMPVMLGDWTGVRFIPQAENDLYRSHKERENEGVVCVCLSSQRPRIAPL